MIVSDAKAIFSITFQGGLGVFSCLPLALESGGALVAKVVAQIAIVIVALGAFLVLLSGRSRKPLKDYPPTSALLTCNRLSICVVGGWSCLVSPSAGCGNLYLTGFGKLWFTRIRWL